MADTMVTTTARSPLAEASNRINSVYPSSDVQNYKSRNDQVFAQNNAYDASRAFFRGPNPQPASRAPSHAYPPAVNAHAQTTLRPPPEADNHKRLSQASQDSSASGRSKKSYKTHIGPWQLGKTLGKGSSARVRLCRHNVTHQLAAVKIVNRRMAYLVQDSSLAALSKWDNSMPEQINGEMRVPMAIEREVAILKLIEHPNIMKLYDIWENRSEIYLILEYIDQGDLFTFINAKGRLSEEVAIFFFRQMISAISYCHSFNICHRDLKPENILISADLQIKIADFGMAALHQTDTHQLATACGSPHYAAPELLKNRQYRGDRADIWSMGVILYAMLSATLPFDDPDLRVMMARTKKGHYQMPDCLTPEAEDLIRRMLQVNPDRRITMREIWRHPLVQKYAYLDNLGDTNGQAPDTRKGFQYTPVPRQDIDAQLVRQLRSMWHMFSESDLRMKLTCEESNDQKAFYWLLYNYREKQLEDFKPEMSHSMSDYHHLKPAVWKKRISTCEFAQNRGNGHGRSISRFTVISNAAETEQGTAQSYDPYRSSRILKPSNSQVSQAKITVHRDSSYGAQTARLRSGSVARRNRMSSVRTSTTGRLQSSKGSLSSLHSSRQGSRQSTPHARGASLRHKRGVDFSHMRKRSGSASQNQNCPPPSYVTDQGSTYQLDAGRSLTPEIPALPSGLLPKHGPKPMSPDSRDASEMFNEELRHFSSNIAKDCDEAFKSSLIEEESIAGSLTDVDRAHRENSPFSFSVESPTGDKATPETEFTAKSINSRPLPPLPSTSELHDQSTPLTSRPVSRDENRELPADQVKLALPVLLPRHLERRVVSASTYTYSRGKAVALPSITEAGVSNDKSRIVSAPPHTPVKNSSEKDRPPLPSTSELHDQSTPLTSRPVSRDENGELPADQVKLALPVLLPRHSERRVVSAPTYTHSRGKAVALPSITEAGVSNDKSRIVSAPPHTPVKNSSEKDRSMEYLSKFENSIRVVNSPSVTSPIPEPLNVRKKANTDDTGRKTNRNTFEIIRDAPEASTSDAQGPMKKKKSSWFKRSSKVESEGDSLDWQEYNSTRASSDVKRTDSSLIAVPTKKKSFIFPFWKNHKSRDSTMSISRGPEDKDSSSDAPVIRKSVGSSKAPQTELHKSGSGEGRNIEVKQSWLARLFKVKPAMAYLCMSTSRRRARQEIVILLREWKKYGIKGIQVDKQRNIIFARVSSRNYLNLKEVSFAAEVMTVIEHGKKQPLSIVRFTQERGAASSFHRVVDTMGVVFDNRGLIVADRNKQKMMIKTLNS